MSRGQQTFRQRDVTKAIKATVKAGIAIGRVEIEKDGRIVIVSAGADGRTGGNPEENEWDAVLR